MYLARASAHKLQFLHQTSHTLLAGGGTASATRRVNRSCTNHFGSGGRSGRTDCRSQDERRHDLVPLLRGVRESESGKWRERVVVMVKHGVVVRPQTLHQRKAGTEDNGCSPDQARTAPSAKFREMFG